MQRNLLLLFLFFVVLVSGVVISNKFASVTHKTESNFFNASSSAAVRVPNIYKNETFGFSVEYPFNLQIKESSPTAITIGTINDLETISEAEIRIANVETKPTATESGEIVFAKSLCNSSLPNQEISCTKVMNETAEIATSGSGIKTFYLEEVTRKKDSGEVETTILKGPFISTTLQKDRTSETVLIIYPPLDKAPNMVNGQLIRDIASSLKTFSATTPSASPK